MTSWINWWRLKLPAYQLFTQPYVKAQIKENIKAPRHWPLWGEFTGDWWIPPPPPPPPQRASNAEKVSIWWRHHAFGHSFMLLWCHNQRVHWNGIVANLMKFSALAALEVVIFRAMGSCDLATHIRQCRLTLNRPIQRFRRSQDREAMIWISLIGV